MEDGIVLSDVRKVCWKLCVRYLQYNFAFEGSVKGLVTDLIQRV